MPRIVDRDERRRLIADALLEIVVEKGTSAVTIREVARRSGWSTGVVSHYFRDRHDLMLGGLRRAAELAADRQLEMGKTLVGRQAVEAILEESLPLDNRRLALSRIFMLFYAEAAVDPVMAKEIDGYLHKARRLTENAIRAAQDLGDMDPSIDPVTTAADLFALADGLSCHALFSDHVLDELRDRSPVRLWVNRLAPRSK